MRDEDKDFLFPVFEAWERARVTDAAAMLEVLADTFVLHELNAARERIGLDPFPSDEDIPDCVDPTLKVMPDARSKKEADAIIEMVLALPTGLLAKLYVLLYEGVGLRIDGAKQAARKYYEGLS